MNKDLLLALTKALQEVATEVDDLAKAEAPSEHANSPHYKAFYEGAKSQGADHRTAHKAAKQYAKKMLTHPKIDDVEGVGRRTGEEHARRNQ